jgi:hypothetical protein
VAATRPGPTALLAVPETTRGLDGAMLTCPAGATYESYDPHKREPFSDDGGLPVSGQ